MIFHLNRSRVTIKLVEVYDGDIIGILSDFGDLVFEVKVGELGDIAGFMVVDWF